MLTKVHKPSENDLVVLEDTADISGCDPALQGSLALVDLEACIDVISFFLGDPLRIFRKVWDHKEKCYSNDTCERALQDEL